MPQNEAVSAMIARYGGLSPNIDGDYPLVVCPKLNTEALLEIGLRRNGQLQNLDGVMILPAEYMNPFDDPTGRLLKTDNTISPNYS